MTGIDETRRVLGARLRELRKQAGLTGIALARTAAWPQSKVSKIECGQQLPTEQDIAEWCRLTGAELQLPDLVASVRNVHAAYQEWKRITAGGHAQRQRRGLRLDSTASLIRGYAQPIPFAWLQTRDYATAILARCIEFIGGTDDLDDAVNSRIRRQQVLHDPKHHFHLLLDQAALYTRVGDEAVRVGQLEHLLEVITWPRVTLGIVPLEREFVYVIPSFTMFDRHTIRVETVSAELTITQPRELAYYEKAWAALQTQAAYGDAARSLIEAAIDRRGR